MLTAESTYYQFRAILVYVSKKKIVIITLIFVSILFIFTSDPVEAMYTSIKTLSNRPSFIVKFGEAKFPSDSTIRPCSGLDINVDPILLKMQL